MENVMAIVFAVLCMYLLLGIAYQFEQFLTGILIVGMTALGLVAGIPGILAWYFWGAQAAANVALGIAMTLFALMELRRLQLHQRASHNVSDVQN